MELGSKTLTCTTPPWLLSRRLLFCRTRSGGEAGPVLAKKKEASSICDSAACEGNWLSERLALKFNGPWCVLAGTHTGEAPESGSDA